MFQTTKGILGLFFKYSKRNMNNIVILFLLLLLKITLQVYNPLYIGRFIDHATEGAEIKVLIRFATVFLALTVIEQVIIVGQNYVGEIVTWKTTNRLRMDLTKHCLNLDSDFFSETTSAELIQRIDGDVEVLNKFFSFFILQILNNFLFLIGLSGVIFSINVTIGFVVLIFTTVGIYVLFRVRNYARNSIRVYQNKNGELMGFMDERILAGGDIKTSGARAYMGSRFNEMFRGLYKIRKKTGFKVAFTTNIGEMVSGLMIAAMIAVLGLAYLSSKQISYGNIFLIYYYITILIVPLKNIVFQLGDLNNIGATVDRIENLMNTKSEIVDEGKKIIGAESVSVSFEHVSFHYKVGNPVLKDISFQLPANRCLGIIGKTGSGKTTITKLLSRNYNLLQGTIYLNGTAIEEFKLSSLRQELGIITQNIELFDGTLRDNITLFQEEISDETIRNGIEELGLSQWFCNLPEGLDSHIDRKGGNLSSGEAQLITILRIYLKNCKLIVLDEATAKLDKVTEKMIHLALKKLFQNKTVFIIAHRQEILEMADYIMELDNGKIRSYLEKISGRSLLRI